MDYIYNSQFSPKKIHPSSIATTYCTSTLQELLPHMLMVISKFNFQTDHILPLEPSRADTNLVTQLKARFGFVTRVLVEHQ